MTISNKFSIHFSFPLHLSLANMSLWKDKAFVNGAWVPAASGSTFEVKNPLNGAVVGTVPDMGKVDTDKAIDAAYEVGVVELKA